MLKRILFLFLSLTLVSTTSFAGTSYDIAYYFGMVTSAGGSTLTDTSWVLTDERGSEDNLTAIYDKPLENAYLIHSNDEFVMFTNFWHDSELGSWVKGNTRVFAVGNNYIEYCALYIHANGNSVIPEKRLRFVRNLEVGQAAVVYGPAKFNTNPGSTDVAAFMNIFLMADSITVDSSDVPQGSDLTGCLRVVTTDGSNLNTGHNVQILAPGRGVVMFRELDTSPPANSDPLGNMNAYLSRDVPNWGNQSSYSTSQGAFTSAGDINSIETTISGLNIPSGYTQSSSGVVVIPMF